MLCKQAFRVSRRVKGYKNHVAGLRALYEMAISIPGRQHGLSSETKGRGYDFNLSIGSTLIYYLMGAANRASYDDGLSIFHIFACLVLLRMLACFNAEDLDLSYEKVAESRH